MSDARPWQDDGKRFVASLQDVTDKSCYKDFFESEKLDETKQKVDEAVEKYQRSAIVFDRKMVEVIYRKVIQSKEVEPAKTLPPRRGRRKAEPKIERKVEHVEPKKKVINKDDYF
jgi:hypothetical protein